MRRFLLKIQFYGKRYSGFQRQKNASTIQGELESALNKLFGVPVEVVGCSRTDAGVSAEEYFCHFDVETKLPEERIAFKLNRFLPKDIQAIESKEVAPTFSARESVKKKTYLYTLYSSPVVLPLKAREGAWCQASAEKMREGIPCLLGKHDFKAFRTLGYEKDAEKKSTVRTIYDIEIKEEDGLIKVYVTGDGFLYNMVRILVGTLVELGEGKRTKESILTALESGDRQNAGVTLPAKGLKLYKVYY